jgi:hypothetical protein
MADFFFLLSLASLSVLKNFYFHVSILEQEILSAPTVKPTFSARNPLVHPMNSSMKILSSETAVSRILSISVAAIFTVVSNPIVSCVPKKSLSIDAGTPTINVPVSLLSSRVSWKEPLPPITIRPSALFNARVRQLS